MLIMLIHSRSLSVAARACPVHAASLRECTRQRMQPCLQEQSPAERGDKSRAGIQSDQCSGGVGVGEPEEGGDSAWEAILWRVRPAG